MSRKKTEKLTNWISSSMFEARYTQDIKIAQMYEWINMAIYVWIRSSYYPEKPKYIINKAFDFKYIIIDYRHQIKVKYNDFLMIGEK